MKVTIDVPDAVFWAAAAKAEVFGQRVDEYAVDLLVTAAASRSPVQHDPILRLWRDGLADAEIGALLNATNATVARRRQALGLPANRRRRSESLVLSVVRTSQYSPSVGGVMEGTAA